MDYDLSHPFGYYHDNRIELIRIREMIQRHQVINASFMMNLIPDNLYDWTIDIANSYDINPDFVLVQTVVIIISLMKMVRITSLGFLFVSAHQVVKEKVLLCRSYWIYLKNMKK